MNAILLYGLTNAVLATALFVIIAVCKSRLRNPAVLHWLWILVLLKLMTPPIWCPKWTVLPPDDTPAVSQTSLSSPALHPLAVTSSPGLHTDVIVSRQMDESGASTPQSGGQFGPSPLKLDQTERPGTTASRQVTSSDAQLDGSGPVSKLRFSLLLCVAVVWGTGAVLLWGLAAWRIFRMQLCLRFAQEAPTEIRQTANLLAAQLGLRKCPQVWLVPGHVSPMLWAFFGPARIIVPSELLTDLDEPSRRTLLLHELVHYRRGDQWVRWLELVSLGLYWWHPVVWLIRREIRLSEELACDAHVVWLRPHERRIYAEMLVNTVAFLSVADVPAFTTGAGTKSHLEGRLKMIMRSGGSVQISRRMKVLTLLFAALFLPLAPVLVRAQRNEVKTTAADPLGKTAADGTTSDVKANQDGTVPRNVEELAGTVVDEAGKPVAGIEIQVYLSGQIGDRVLKTNESGQFRIPQKWRPDEFDDMRAVLLVRKGDSHLGWFDLQSLLPFNTSSRKPPVDRDTFRIVLLALTQTIRGTLVDPDGKPLSDIRVAIDGMSNPQNQGINHEGVSQDHLVTTTTNQNGMFEIRLPAGTHGNLAPHHPDWQRTLLAVKPDISDMGRITLRRAGRIQGRVVDTTGKPLAGQGVFAQLMSSNQRDQGFVGDGDATTDREGRYTIGGLSPGRFNVLFTGKIEDAAKVPLLTAVAVEGVEVVETKPVQADFQASAGRRLSGKVLESESGRPIAKILVGYYGSARPNSTPACMMVRTKEDGTFEFRVPPGVSRVYVASSGRPGTTESGRTLEVAPDKDLVNILLEVGKIANDTATSKTEVKTEVKVETQKAKVGAGPTAPGPYKLRVNALSPEGRKVNNVQVHVAHTERNYISMQAFLSGNEYDLPFFDQNDGRQALLVLDANGYATARSAEFVIREQMPELTVRLAPEAFVPIRGRVVDQAGKPVENARVRIARLIFGRQESFPWGLEYLTRSDGRYEIKHARVGDRIQVRIDKRGTGGAQAEWLSIEGQEPRVLPDLRLGKPDKEVGGVVRDYEGFDIANAKVIHFGEPRVETTTDSKGKFHLTGLPTGTVSLAVEPVGLPRTMTKVLTGKLNHEIHVDSITPQDRIDYSVKVNARPQDGKEVERMTIYFCVENGHLLSTMQDRKGNSYTFSFPGEARRFKDQKFAVVIAADGYARPEPAIVLNQRGPQTVEIDLEPATPVTLRGRVIDDAGQPVAEAKVGLSVALTDQSTADPWRYPGKRSKLPVTDANGKFEITGVQRNSRVAVYINKLGYAGAWSERVVADNPEGVEWPDLRLPISTRVLSGQVVDEQGRPIADAKVSSLDIVDNTTSTDAQGRFRLEKVVQREFRLYVTGASVDWAELVPSNATELKVKLKP